MKIHHEHKPPSKLVFLSDLHFGGGPHRDNFNSFQELTLFIDELEASSESTELVLLGDILELLEVTPKGSLNKLEHILEGPAYRALFERFERFSKRHTVRYLIGNHDREVIWNKSIQKALGKFGMTLENPPETSRAWRFQHGDLWFTLHAEHGNQFDPPNRYDNLHEPLETPLGEHIVTDLVKPFKRLLGSSEPWAADIDNVRPLEAIPWWIFSRYFYHETNRVLRFFLLPILVSFALTRILPIVLIWLHLGLQTLDAFFKIPKPFLLTAFVLLFFDLTILLVALFLYLIKQDLQKTLKSYGLGQHRDILKRRDRMIQRSVAEVLGRPELDFVVFGHTHQRLLESVTVGSRPKGYANTGTWTKVMWRVNAHFKLPPVFLPRYALSYVVARQRGEQVTVELRERGKAVEPPELTPLEKIAISGKKVPPSTRASDILLKSLTYALHP